MVLPAPAAIPAACVKILDHVTGRFVRGRTKPLALIGIGLRIQSLLVNLQIEIDTKAMRKQKDAQTLGWMIEMIILSGGGTYDFGLSARHLYKLS